MVLACPAAVFSVQLRPTRLSCDAAIVVLGSAPMQLVLIPISFSPAQCNRAAWCSFWGTES